MKSFSTNQHLEAQEILSEFDEMPSISTSEQWNHLLLKKIDAQQVKPSSKSFHKLTIGLLLIIVLNAGIVVKIMNKHQPAQSNRQQQLEMVASSLMITSNN